MESNWHLSLITCVSEVQNNSSFTLKHFILICRIHLRESLWLFLLERKLKASRSMNAVVADYSTFDNRNRFLIIKKVARAGKIVRVETKRSGHLWNMRFKLLKLLNIVMQHSDSFTLFSGFPRKECDPVLIGSKV